MPPIKLTLSKLGEDLSLFSINSDESNPNCTNESITIRIPAPGLFNIPMRVVKAIKLQFQPSKDLTTIKPKMSFDNECLIKHFDISNSNLLQLTLRFAEFFKKSVKPRSRPISIDFDCEPSTPTNPSNTPYLQPVITNPEIKLNPSINNLIDSTLAGLENGHVPVLSTEGTGGAYIMNGLTGCEFISLFKPVDEEPMAVNNPRGFSGSLNGEGLKKGTKVGEGALREVAAYLLDHPLSGPRSSGDDDVAGFSGVMETVMVRCWYDGCTEFKIGSLQKFKNNIGSSEELGPGLFSIKEVHKICVLDIRLGNADRHAGNILVWKDEDLYRLVPIDHGYCLPENFEDCTFDWLSWRQAREPFDEETIEYVNSLDAELDISILKSYGWDLSIECRRTLRIGTMLLKKGVERGLTPFQIGNIMCRETQTEESKIEEIIKRAEIQISCLEEKDEKDFMQCVSSIMDPDLDEISSMGEN